MKLILLHGPAVVVSRKKLTDIRGKFDSNNVIVFEEGSTLADIVGAIRTIPMFEEIRLIILENPPELSFDSFTPTESRLTLLVWFDHEIDPKKFSIKASEIYFFPEAKEISVFPFLDFLGTKDKRAFLELDKLINKGFDTQYIVTMIFYLLRSLVVSPKNVPEFVKNKILRQKANFSEADIQRAYRRILETDFKLKSGLIDDTQTQFLLVSIFANFS